jgi:hypothetical protein
VTLATRLAPDLLDSEGADEDVGSEDRSEGVDGGRRNEECEDVAEDRMDAVGGI